MNNTTEPEILEVTNAEGKVFIGTSRECAEFLKVRPASFGRFMRGQMSYYARFKNVTVKKHVPVLVKEDSEVSSKRKLMKFEENGLYINRYANYVVCISANHLHREYKFVALYPKSNGTWRIAADNNELCVSITDEFGLTKKKRGVKKQTRSIYPIDVNGLDQAGLTQFLELREWYAKHKGLTINPVRVNVVVAQTTQKTTVVSTVKEAGPLADAVIDDRLKNLETLMETLLKEKEKQA